MNITNIRLFLAVSAAFAVAGAAQAAYRWMPKTGGDLGTAENWSGTGPDYQINGMQSAPLTLAADMTMAGKLDVKLDNASGVYTNLFAATLTVAGTSGMETWAQAGWHQVGGGLTLSGGGFICHPSGQGDGVWFDGAAVQIATGKAFYIKLNDNGTTDSSCVWTNGASLSVPNGSFFYEGGSPYVQALFTGEKTTLSLKELRIGRSNGTASGGSRMTFADGATATASGYVNAGEAIGNNVLSVTRKASLSTVNFYLAKGNAANAAVTNNLTLIDGAAFTLTGGAFEIGQLPGTQGNVFCATNGATVTLTGAANGTAYVGKNSANNRMIVTGEGTTASVSYGGGLKIGDPGDSGGTNLLLVADQATMSIPNGYLYVGFAADAAPDVPAAGEENRLEVRDGGKLTANAIRVYPKSRVVVDGGTLSLTSSIEQWKDSAAVFTGGATLNLLNESLSFLGGTGAELAVTNSTIVAEAQVRFSGSNCVCRVHNSTLNLKGGMGLPKVGTAYVEKNFVFSGASPRLETTTVDLSAFAKFRFELPPEGFDPDRAVVEATAAAGFKYDNVVGPRSVVVSVPPKCAEGTYTLLRGKNATADWITTTVEPFDTSALKVKVLRTMDAEGVEVLQVRVDQKKGLMLIFR